MSSRRSAGFTLIEMIIAMVVISVGLAGVMSAFNTVLRSSADPLVQKQMLALAEEMMEEVMLKPYVAPNGSIGAIAGCDRSAADEIADYNNYNRTTCAIDGSPVGGLGGYTTKVTVVPTALGTAVAPATVAIPAASASLVTVTVTNGGGQAITLHGWRANYAANLPP